MALTPVHELQALIRRDIASEPVDMPSEKIVIAAAVGRVLAEDVVSAVNIPPADVSAMDGYALPTAAPAGSRWVLSGESSAGHVFTGRLNDNGCLRIMTGAVVPEGCTTVVMQENTEKDGDEIVLSKDAAVGQNIRYAGEEIQSGTTVLTRGRILREADVLLLAALGYAEVAVYRKIRVAVLSTGDELHEPGTPVDGKGGIYDSNRHMLMARLRQLPVDVIDLHKVGDNLDNAIRVLEDAAQRADVVLTSGGVSVGDYDYMRDAVESMGKIHHYKVAMKPGKPFVFGRIAQAWYFGLPGNPISGYVGFDMFLKAALWQLCGAVDVPQPLRFSAVLSAPVKKAPGRADIQRGIITQQADGSWTAEPCGSQDSHRIWGISRANAYIVLSEESGLLAAGETVTVQPFGEAFL